MKIVLATRGAARTCEGERGSGDPEPKRIAESDTGEAWASRVGSGQGALQRKCGGSRPVSLSQCYGRAVGSGVTSRAGRTAKDFMPPQALAPPRCDRSIRQICDISPNSPDHALRFTAIRASERFHGREPRPALSDPLPRSAVTNARARNARHDAPRGPIRPPRRSTKRPASTSRRAFFRFRTPRTGLEPVTCELTARRSTN